MVTWRIWVKWTLATALGCAGSVGLLSILVLHSINARDATIGIILGGPAIGLVLIGTTVGVAQWLVLRPYIGRVGWWILASAGGWAVGLVVGLIAAAAALYAGFALSGLSEFGEGLTSAAAPRPVLVGLAGPTIVAVAGGILGSVAGAVAGVAQSFVLRTRITRAGRWTGVSAAGWAFGSAIGSVTATASSFFAGRAAVTMLGSAYGDSVLGAVVFGTVAGAISGAFTGAKLGSWVNPDALSGQPAFVERGIHAWLRLDTTAKAVTAVGTVILLASLGLVLLLGSAEFGARLLDGGVSLLAASACNHPELSIDTDKRTMTDKESMVLGATLSNRDRQRCDFTVKMQATSFDFSPPQTSQSISLAPAETGTVTWIISPRTMGTYKIVVASGLEYRTTGIIVTDVFGLTIQQTRLLSYAGTFFGPALAFPWLYTTWRKRRKDKAQGGAEAIPEPKVTSILFVAADPTDASRLRLGEEFREIQEKLKLARLRGHFRLELPQLSVRPADISQGLLDTQPEIVHFSGHGTSTGALCFEDPSGQTHLVQPEALAALFEQFSQQVKCVLLNACYSESQARAIAAHIEHVIGMNQAIGDRAAIAFAVGFYQALGAGRTIQEAYELGRVQVRLQGIPEYLTPVLIKRGQADQPSQ